LGQRPVQYDVHPMNGARRQRATASSAGPQQMLVEVVNVDCGQLVNRHMTQ
jgi:hypothetical protein